MMRTPVQLAVFVYLASFAARARSPHDHRDGPGGRKEQD
jgi:hypothetical protein